MTKREVKILHIYCVLALVVAAMILGLSFTAQKAGMAYVGPFTFNTLRFFIGSLSLLPVIGLMKNFVPEPKLYSKFSLIKGGLLAGVVLFVAFTINQYCMIFADAGKGGFLTSLYIVFVPVLAVFLKQKISRNILLGLIFAMLGVYLLCANEGFSFEVCDIFLVVSAFFFAIHILIVSHFTKKVSAVKLSCLQFLIAGVLSFPLMFTEHPQISEILAGYRPILFIGIVVTGVAYTLQIFGQKAVRPIVATLILSSEAVFAVLGGMLILGETLSVKEILGCVVMVAAIIISQLKH